MVPEMSAKMQRIMEKSGISAVRENIRNTTFLTCL